MSVKIWDLCTSYSFPNINSAVIHFYISIKIALNPSDCLDLEHCSKFKTSKKRETFLKVTKSFSRVGQVGFCKCSWFDSILYKKLVTRYKHFQEKKLAFIRFIVIFVCLHTSTFSREFHLPTFVRYSFSSLEDMISFFFCGSLFSQDNFLWKRMSK